MKRVFSLLLALVMVVGMLPLSTLAAGTGAEMHFETTFTKGMAKGEKFTVTAFLDQNPGLANITLSLDWNPNVVNFTGFDTIYDEDEDADIVVSDILGPYTVVYNQVDGIIAAARAKNSTKTGKFFTANFEIIAGGEPAIGLKTGLDTDRNVPYFEMTNAEMDEVASTIDFSALSGLTASGDKIVNMPEDAPFTAITTDAGSILDIEEMGYGGGVPYYVVTIPAGATTAYVTAPDQVVMEDQALGKDMATAYAADMENNWSQLYISYDYEETEAGPKVEIPMYMTASDFSGGEVELCFVETEDASATHAFGIENSLFACLGYISFKYGEASSTPEPEEPVTYKVTVQAAEKGTVTADKEAYEEGDKVTLTVTPATGYELKSLTVMNGETEVEVTNNQFTMPAGDVTVTAEFRQITYTVTVGNASNGTVTADKTSAAAGDKVTLTVAPATGYELDTLTAQGVTFTQEDGKYTFSMPASDVEITPSFKKSVYNVTVVDAEHGTVTANPATANYGDEISLTVEPAAGYRLKSLVAMKDGDNNVLNPSNAERFNMPAGNVTVTAEFEKITYAVTVGDVTNGTVEVEPTAAAEGETVNVTATPADGYQLVKVLVNGEPIEGNSFTMPGKAVTVTAEFELLPPATYAVNIGEISNGSVTVDKNAAEKSETVTVTVTPNTGYELESLTVMNGDTAVEVTNNQFTMPEGDVVITASFKKSVYTITVTAGENGSVTAPATANYGDEINLNVVPAEGYQLVAVKVDGEAINGTSFTMPANDVTVTAEFERIPVPTYTVTVGEVANGTVTVDKETAEEGATVNVTATPAEGYQLETVMVNGEAIEGTSFTMPAQNVTVTATFTAVQPPEQPQVEGYSITMDADKTGILVNGNTTVSLTVGHDTLNYYNSYKLELTYDPSKVTLTTATDDNNNIAVSDENGSVIITRFGENLSASIDLTFKAVALGEAEVKLTKAYISDTDAALKGDAPAAAIIDGGEITVEGITTITVTGYDVDLSKDFSSEQMTLTPGEDLSFVTTISPYYNYDIVVQVQKADGSWTTLENVEISGSGTAEAPYVIKSKYITGNIQVRAANKEGKKYDVTISGDYAAALAPAQGYKVGDDAAQYMMENGYQAVLTPDSKFEYNVVITVGGNTYNCTPVNNVYTIAGADITGDITFTVNAKQVTFDPHNVTINGSGAGDVVEGTAAGTAEHNEDYTFHLKLAEGWDYTVTATMGGTSVTPVKAETANEDKSYTYTISAVTGDLVITIEKTNLKVEVNEYLDLDDSTMFLITATKDLAEGQTALAYNGHTMLYSEQYEAWAYLVIIGKGETFDADVAKADITVGSTEFVNVPATLDVNKSGVVDINDAQLVYDMYAAKKYQDLTQPEIMEKLLRADTAQGESAKKLDVLDARAVVADILK